MIILGLAIAALIGGFLGALSAGFYFYQLGLSHASTDAIAVWDAMLKEEPNA